MGMQSTLELVTALQGLKVGEAQGIWRKVTARTRVWLTKAARYQSPSREEAGLRSSQSLASCWLKPTQ